MSGEFEIDVPVPPDVVMERLVAARKEMAPKIGACRLVDDSSNFVCHVRYGSAYAVITAQAQGEGTRATVAIHRSSFWRTWWAIGVVVGAMVFDYSISHNFYLTGTIFVLVAFELAFIPLSKQVLIRFIRQTLESDAIEPIALPSIDP